MDSRLSRLTPSPSPRDFTLQKAEFNGDYKTRSKPLKLNFLSIKAEFNGDYETRSKPLKLNFLSINSPRPPQINIQSGKPTLAEFQWWVKGTEKNPIKRSAWPMKALP
jgi:hypothetical protein